MKQNLWNSMLDADMNARYWKRLAKIYSSVDMGIKSCLAILTSGSVAGWQFWSANPGIWKTLSAIAAVVSIILPIIQLSKSINKMSNLTGRWLQIQYDYEMLWADCLKNENHQNIPKRYKDIKNREVSVKNAETDLPEYKGLIKKCYDDVLRARGLGSNT